MPQLLIVNVSLPEEVEKAVDTRSSMGIVGDMNSFQQFQMGQAMTAAATNPAGGGAAEGMGLGMGLAMANRMAGAAMPGGADGASAGPRGGELARRRQRSVAGPVLATAGQPRGRFRPNLSRHARLERRHVSLDCGRASRRAGRVVFRATGPAPLAAEVNRAHQSSIHPAQYSHKPLAAILSGGSQTSES